LGSASIGVKDILSFNASKLWCTLMFHLKAYCLRHLVRGAVIEIKFLMN